MLKNKILLLLIILLLPISIKALEETTLLYEENPTHYIGFHNVVIDEDNNIVVVGYDEDDANSSYKSIISKYKLDGTLIWKKEILTANKINRAYGITLAPDGYIVVGGAHINTSDDDTDTSFDAYIYKISKDGEIVWHKEESTVGSDRYEKVITAQDGFVAAGYMTSEYFIPSGEYVDKNAYIRKVDNEGNKVWENTYGGNNLDWYYSLVRDGDNIIAVGYTASTNIEGITNIGNKDGLVVKYNADGTIAWAKNYGGTNDDEIHNIALTSDGYILTGKTVGENEDDYWFLKINNDGEEIWQKTYNVNIDEPWAIIPRDNKYYIFGHSITNAENQTYESYVLEINGTSGEIEKVNKYTKNVPVLFRSAAATADGFVAVGFTRIVESSDIFAGPLIVRYSFASDVPGDDSHEAVDPTVDPEPEPETKPEQPKEDNPKTGAFLTASFVILIIVGLIVFNIRRGKIYNI